jgi:16S rRNA (cytidine1402-2'-O)-methyltransferase
VVLAEDTRVTRKLFARYEITTPLERYDEHTAARRTPDIVARIANGQVVALCSDAGTPGISDPGAMLVDAAIAAGLPVDVLPGASAIITALVASGLPTHAFYFGGFLPRKAGDRSRLLATLEHLDATLVFYESPRRTAATLDSLAVAFPGRDGAMARELTKLHQEVVRGPLPELAEQIGARENLKGEVVVLVGPPVPVSAVKADADSVDTEAVRARMAELMAAGAKRGQAAKEVAREYGMDRGVVYDLALEPGDAV